MRESWVPKPITWPKEVLPKGAPGWEDSLTRWLCEQLPAQAWQHQVLAGNPWAAVILAAVTNQHVLAGLREDYQRAGRMRGLIGDEAADRLRAAIVVEATRIKRVLEHLFVIEHAITPGSGGPTQAELGMRGPVRGGP